MPTPDDMADTMRANVEEKTGKPLAHWLHVLRDAGFAKHGEMVKHLKTEHGVTHGFANLIVHDFRSGNGGTSEDPVDLQYTDKKAHLRPVYDAVAAFAAGLGPDVEFAPKKAYVSLRRSKQFATVGPATNSAIEVGLNLKGHPTTDRLMSASGMCTHRVRLSSTAELDAELKGWVTTAYDAA